MRSFAAVALVAILSALVCSCDPAELPPDWPANAAYPIDVAPGGIAQLKDGVFEAPAAPRSASKIRVHLTETQAVGHIDNDAVDDFAVILTAETGGSGTFTYLAAVLNENGKPKPVASVLLGDRIQVQRLRIDGGTIQATILTRRPDEPMAAKPTMEMTRTFRLDNGKLTEAPGR